MKVLHKRKCGCDCNNYGGIPLVAHAGKVLLKIITSSLSNYFEEGAILPEEQWAYVRRGEQWICCSSCADCKNSRAVWGMLYADDAGIVSKSAEGLAKMITVIVTVFEDANLTVLEGRRRPCYCEHGTCIPGSTVRHRRSRTEV